MIRLLTLLTTVAMLVSACSGASQGETLVGIRASNDPAVGDARFLFAVSEIDGTRRGSPEEKVTLVATSLDAPDVSIDADAVFEWIVEDGVGLYRANIPFDRPGLWEIDFQISTGEQTEPFLVDVSPEPSTVAAGDMAPLVKTPTLSDRPIEELTTDWEPLPALYEMSLDEALTNGRPTVVIFATPAYCTSAACGPLLKQTKAAVQEYPDVDFLHIEVYEGFNEEGFAPDRDHVVEAVKAFRLATEPWVFVVDEGGVVTARFEGVLGADELAEALDG